MRSLYQQIASRIKAATPGVWVDLWNNQPDYETEQLPVPYPAAFVEVGQVQFRELDRNTQIAEGTVLIHVVQEQYKDTFSGVDITWDGIEVFHLPEQIVDALHGANTKWMEMQRSSERIEAKDGLLLDYVIGFDIACTYDMPRNTQATPAPSPEVQTQFRPRT